MPPKYRQRQGKAGGPATTAGSSFQAQAAARLSVTMLAGESPPEWMDGRSDATITRIEIESTTQVDDIAVTTGRSDGTATRVVLVQSKMRLLLRQRPNSTFGAAIEQIVAQFASRRILPSLGRPFALGRDRVVLLVGPTSSRQITEDLETALATVRATGAGLAAARRKLSKRPRDALRTLLSLVRRAWKRSQGAHSDESSLVRMVRAIYVATLPEAHETPSSLLRIVRGGGQERRAAWNALVRLWSSAAEVRGDHDRASLRDKLRDEGVALLPDPDLAGDIDRLKTITEEELACVSRLAAIRFRDRVLHVERACTVRLIDAVRCGGVAVIGDPGAGKSGVLHDAVTWLRQSNRDVVFVTTERLARGSEGGQSPTLGLDHALVDVLAGWTGAEAAFLVIDAIDASRSTEGLARILTLLAHVKAAAPRWTQVVSIRRFDLRCSGRIQELFHGSVPDPEFSDPHEFRNVAHFLVPGFTADEVDQLAVQSPELVRAARAVLAEMGDRIWVPFHLRLLAAVVETTPDADSMPSVPTAGSLLDLYWERCVVRRKDGEGAQGARRLRAVIAVVRSMVRRKRLLLKVTEIAAKWSSQIPTLISDGVLVEVQAPGVCSVQFAHHALFDYVAARAALSVDDPATLTKLAADPETALAFRPSLSLSFQRLWDADADRESFWDTARSWQEDLSSASLWLVPALVAARSLQDPRDLEPLLRHVRCSAAGASRSSADVLLGLVIAVGVNGNCAALVGRDRASWCELARALGAEPLPCVAWNLRFLLLNLVAQLGAMTAREVASAGAASRSLLQYAAVHDERLVESALQCVAMTAASNSVETAAAIAPLLSHEEIARRGYRTLQTLSFHILPVIHASPELAGRIFEAAYTYEETSREATPMGGSQIISMTSNRKQDFDGARYHLAEELHELASIDLGVASRVVRRAFAAVQGAEGDHASYAEFCLRGRAMRLRGDGRSFRFEKSHLASEDPERLLSSWRSELESLHERPDRDSRLAAALDALASGPIPARVMQVLLEAAASEVEWLGREIRAIAWTSPLLQEHDLTRELGQLIRALYPHLPPAEQEAVEEAVFSLPEFDRVIEDADEERRSPLSANVG